MHSVTISFLAIVLISGSVVPAYAAAASRPSAQKSASGGAVGATSTATGAEFDSLRERGNDALYNLDYQTARELFQQMIKIAPDHPAGYVYLANNFWLETLNAGRRLSSSLYSGGSFYEQDAEQDKVDPKREREFSELIRRALAVATARLQKDAKDVEALYYEAAALGLRAGYNVTVKRSFRRAIGDANESIMIQRKVVKLDPNYVDAYLSIGLYDYIIDNLPWVWRTLARLAGLSGSKKRGIERLEMVTKSGKYTADDARVLLIGIYTRERQPERALEMITYLANKYPRNYLLGIERAGMLFRMNRPAEGNQAYGDLLKDSRVAQAAADAVNYQWGEALMGKGSHAEAVERYQEVVKWPKADPSLVSLAHLHAGQALDCLGKREQAIAEYQVVLKRDNVFDSHKVASEYVKRPYAPGKS
jgi:tetratricopeptide (TPR) repeat protein